MKEFFGLKNAMKRGGLPDSNRIERSPTVGDATPSSSFGFDSEAMSNFSSALPNVPPRSTSQETAPGSSRDGSKPSTEGQMRRAWTIWRADHKRFDKEGREIHKAEGNGLLMKMVDSNKALGKFFGLATLHKFMRKPHYTNSCETKYQSGILFSVCNPIPRNSDREAN